MGLPARRLTELNTWSGPTRSSSSTGDTTTTMMRRLAEGRRTRSLCGRAFGSRKRNERNGAFRRICVGMRRAVLRILPSMNHRWLGVVGAALIVGAAPPARLVAQTGGQTRSEEHTSELQSPCNLVCRLLLEKKKNK